MTNEYTYRISLVNEELKFMEVEYSKLGMDAITVGMPIPYTDILLSDYISMYAPIKIWDEATKTLQVVEVGATGHGVVMQLAEVVPVTQPAEMPVAEAGTITQTLEG